MSSTPLPMSTVVAHIQQHTDGSDLDNIMDAVKARRQLLRDQAAAAVKPGIDVVIRDISPKYLKGLRGTVKTLETIGRKRCAVVTLDQASTSTLAFSTRKFAYLAGKDSHDLTGVPLSCCAPA